MFSREQEGGRGEGTNPYTNPARRASSNQGQCHKGKARQLAVQDKTLGDSHPQVRIRLAQRRLAMYAEHYQ